MITLKNVKKEYVEGVPALDDINIHINTGEFVFVVETADPVNLH
ncbi:MAG: hypothetical protein V8R80_01820 [Eubacterium sp.]